MMRFARRVRKDPAYVLIFLAAAIAGGASLGAQAVPDISYDANADFLTLPPNTFLGEVAGVATNSKGHLFVYTRTGHAVATLGDERTFYHGGSRLFQFDQAGKFVKEIGQGTYAMNFAQQVRVDPQDNVWIVDSGSNMVVKFDADGRLQFVLGRKPENIGVRPGPGMPSDGKPPAEPPAGRGAGPEGGRGGGGRGNAVPGIGVPATASTGRRMWPGIARAMCTSPTDSAPTAASRNSTRTPISRNRGDRPDPGPDNSTRFAATRGTFTWPTPATIASRFLTAT